MSTLQDNKLLSEKFIENAGDDVKSEIDLKKNLKEESEKMILDEMDTEKTEKDSVDNAPDSSETNSEKRNEDIKEDEKPEWQDILGSGAIMKKILAEGQLDSRPERSARCRINYVCKLEDETLVEEVKDFELRLGEFDVVQGLDVAVGLMNLREKCVLKIEPRLAYGEKGFPPNVPGNVSVIFEAELVSVDAEDDVESLSIQERREIGNQKRERGNWWYQRGENTLAVQCYRRALDYLDEVDSGMLSSVSKEDPKPSQPSDSELQALLEDRIKVSNNMASAQIKMELFDQAMLSLQTVLRCQPNNAKALFRKAKVHIGKNELQTALKCLERARSLEPEDGLIAKEINLVNSLIHKQKNSEREYARRMFRDQSKVTPGSDNAGKVKKGANKSTFQVWATLGATFFIGLAGAMIYRFKYP